MESEFERNDLRKHLSPLEIEREDEGLPFQITVGWVQGSLRHESHDPIADLRKNSCSRRNITGASPANSATTLAAYVGDAWTRVISSAPSVGAFSTT
ncbi:hypothetical protein WKW77_24550 [Variovorax ureilyticus]|uniref:Uncharacterized protein n=1 Tax=Variovorax ureilyticus TaxID=1836198 RepID=A0ABU8VKS8_9BURK